MLVFVAVSVSTIVLAISNPVLSIGTEVEQLNLNLTSCFKYHRGFRLELGAPDIESTESVQFKDDCLRACLRARLVNSFVCRSLMHMPRDDDCVLTALSADKAVRIDDKPTPIPVNFYENRCADAPINGGMVNVQLRGFRGGEGVMDLVQQHGANPLLFMLLDGMQGNKVYDVIFNADVVKDCFKMHVDDRNDQQKLISISSDSNGMAIQPWTEVQFDILHDSVLNRTITVLDRHSGIVLLCGTTKLKSTTDQWKVAKSNCNFIALNNFLLILFAITSSKLSFL